MPKQKTIATPASLTAPHALDEAYTTLGEIAPARMTKRADLSGSAPLSTEPSGDAAKPGQQKRGRGRPQTRSRLSLLFFVWVKVREEIAYQGAPNALQACEQLIARLPVIRIRSDDRHTTVNLYDVLTLHRWYRGAECERTKESELATRCAAWEAQRAADWPDYVGRLAYNRSLINDANRGLSRTAENYVELNRRAATARSEAMADTPPFPRPRKNRR